MVQPVKRVFNFHWISGIQGWYFSFYPLLRSWFKLRGLGFVHFFLGIEVKSITIGLLLSQHKYELDIIQREGMAYCKPVDTPLSTLSKLGIMHGTLHSDLTRYRQIVGALQYLTFTRPNICYTFNKVCQFMHVPTEDHWAVVKRILHYLQATTFYGLHITRDSSLSFHGFTNSVVYIFLVLPLFHGNLGNNTLLLGLLQRHNTKP
jgi:histone deacetylase 1/2